MPTSAFNWSCTFLGSVTMPGMRAVFWSLILIQVGRQWRGLGPGLRGSGWEDPGIRGGRCAGARAQVRLAPAGQGPCQKTDLDGISEPEATPVARTPPHGEVIPMSAP